MENKFKQFWIFPGETDLTGFKGEHIALTQPANQKNLIHVIERSALESANAEIAELKADKEHLGTINNTWAKTYELLKAEIDELKFRLEGLDK